MLGVKSFCSNSMVDFIIHSINILLYTFFFFAFSVFSEDEPDASNEIEISVRCHFNVKRLRRDF